MILAFPNPMDREALDALLTGMLKSVEGRLGLPFYFGQSRRWSKSMDDSDQSRSKAGFCPFAFAQSKQIAERNHQRKRTPQGRFDGPVPVIAVTRSKISPGFASTFSSRMANTPS